MRLLSRRRDSLSNPVVDTPAQLENRAINAPLLRYVDSMRTHGHRAASIDPLDLIHREEVAALDPTRYGLTDENKRYNVDGIVWTKPVEESRERAGEGEWWTLKEITRHLREVYVGRIAYEVSISSGYVWTLLTWVASICIPRRRRSVCGSPIC